MDSQICLLLLLQIVRLLVKMTEEMKHFPEHVLKLLTSARIPVDQLKPVYYELTIGEQFPDDSVRLIEVNKTLLEELEKNKK